MSRTEYLAEALAALEAAGRRRGRRELETTQGAHIRLDGRDVVNFSSNDYLGLAAHPVVRAAASAAAERWGAGAGSSRLVVGNTGAHAALEAALAAWGRRAAIGFNSGYAANTGILGTLVGDGDAIFSDALNHASLIDGCRLTRAAVKIYRHLDLDHLEQQLRATPARRRVIVTESVFSMDGDCTDLAAVARIADAADALLFVDEAHAIGIAGPEGRGVAAAQGVTPDLLVGTIGKALGVYGAFAWTEPAVAEWLWNRARPLVFTTGLPPMVVAAATAAVEIVRSAEGDRLRAALQARVGEALAGIAVLGLRASANVAPESAIVPVVVGDDRRVMECTQRMLARGVFVQGIRPPTVPEGTARLRITLSAAHSREDVGRLLEGLGDLVRDGLISPPAPVPVPRGTQTR